MSSKQFIVGTVHIKECCCENLLDDTARNRIQVLFGVRLQENSGDKPFSRKFHAVMENVSPDRNQTPPDLITRLQSYLDNACTEKCIKSTVQQVTGSSCGGGDDSSYDSDCDGSEGTASAITAITGSKHQDISRTTSDTLAAEYADYVDSKGDPTQHPGYKTRLEYGSRLGYTELEVLTVLSRIGPAPDENDLLAELIQVSKQLASTVLKPTADDASRTLSSATAAPATTTTTITLGPSSPPQLRPIVIDGSNVAMSHGNKQVFSCRGIRLAVDWFLARGHRDVTVFVPKWRKEAPRLDNCISDQELLVELERDRHLVFTPSRLVAGKRTVCYDDRYVLKLALEIDGIVVSNDNYKDLCQENADFRRLVQERALMYTFVNDLFMPPDDPLGRGGPTLDVFLRTKDSAPPPPPCPYGRKCTYGHKCKYHHPERGTQPQKSVSERLVSEHAQRQQLKTPLGRTHSAGKGITTVLHDHSNVTQSHSVDTGGKQMQEVNLHRRLQRQLTLNPLGGAEGHYMTGTTAVPAPPPQHFMQQTPHNWNLLRHQNVTRIASAPDSYCVWPMAAATPPTTAATPPQLQCRTQMSNSSSDTQLNMWPTNFPGAVGPHQPPLHSSYHQEEARRKMHYHLAAIFPEEQVRHAMQMYPEELNPQRICAAILQMSSTR